MNKNKRKIYFVLGHLGFWLMVFLFNWATQKNSNIIIDYKIMGFNLFYSLLMFYVTYFVLMPFLLQKKIWLFMILSLSFLFASIFIKGTFSKDLFEKRRLEITQEYMDKSKNKSDAFLKETQKRPPTVIGRQFAFAGLGLLFFFILSVSLRFMEKWLENEKQKSQLLQDNVKTELAFLKQQINPHFLFNSLNSIYSLSISKSEKTTPSILKLSSILRYMLYETEPSRSSLKNELSVIQDYIELQKLRLTEKVEVMVNMQSEFDDYKFEPFIILPIIENAFKYGVDNLNNSFISIDIMVENQLLDLKVVNKVVQRPAMLRKDSGIGLNNIKRRLEILYPNQHQFTSDENNEVFIVKMQIKLKNL